MKSVLIAIRPKWVEKICHKIGEDEAGKAIYEKRIEVRKTAPQEVPFKCYIYCCKGNNGYEWLYRVDDNGRGKAQSWHGKVIGEFICDKVDKIMTLQHTYYNFLGVPLATITEYGIWNDDLPQMCLTKKEIEDYGKGKTLYGWHISDLKIYDKPRNLSEFGKVGFGHEVPLKRPPQSWMHIEDLGEAK